MKNIFAPGEKHFIYIYIFPRIFFYSSLFLLVGNTTGNVTSIFPGGKKIYRFFKFHFENETPRRTSMIVNWYAEVARKRERKKAKVTRIKFRKNFRRTFPDYAQRFISIPRSCVGKLPYRFNYRIILIDVERWTRLERHAYFSPPPVKWNFRPDDNISWPTSVLSERISRLHFGLYGCTRGDEGWKPPKWWKGKEGHGGERKKKEKRKKTQDRSSLVIVKRDAQVDAG